MAEKDKFFIDVDVNFAYSATLELVSSLHVISDSSHHTNCVNWYDKVEAEVDKDLINRIKNFGKMFVGWSYVMDIVDYLIQIPHLQDNPSDDFQVITKGIENMPIGQFAYIFLGETLLGDHELSERILSSEDMFSNYKISDLKKYIKWKDARYFIRNVDLVRGEMLDIMTLYHECFFSDYWEKNRFFYKSALINEFKIFNSTTVSNYVLSLHDNLLLENNILLIKKETLFKIQMEEIHNIKIIFSTYTYPHLMMNIYRNSLSLYENLLIPNMSTVFDDIANSTRIFGDSTRLAILKLLLNSAATTKTLAKLLNMTPASVSQHLKILKDAGILSSHRDKNNVIYHVNRDGVVQVMKTLKNFLELNDPI